LATSATTQLIPAWFDGSDGRLRALFQQAGFQVYRMRNRRPNRLRASLGWCGKSKGKPSTRAKWRSSECTD
jgi:hypothetical protein